MECRFKGIPKDENLSENAQMLLVEDGTVKRAPVSKVGGGSGGVTSWNDLQDKPFETVAELIDTIKGELPNASGVSF